MGYPCANGMPGVLAPAAPQCLKWLRGVWQHSMCYDLHSGEGMPTTLLCKGRGLHPQIPTPFPLSKG